MSLNGNWVTLIAVLALALAPPPTAQAEDIVVGMSAAFTGPSRGLGIELYRGSIAYLEHARRQGLLDGRRVTIKAYDDGYQPDPAVRNTIRLIDEDKVFLLFDYVGTPTVARVLPLLLHQRYRQSRVYMLFPFTGAMLQRQMPYQPFVYNLRASYREETRGLVDHFLAVGRPRIAVFFQADAYGRTGWDGVRRALDGRGLTMVGEATYRRGARFNESFSRQVEILRSHSPDAVICVGAYAACAGFIRDARDAGWNVPVANLSFVDSDNLLALLKVAEKRSKQRYTDRLIVSQVVPSYEDTRLPAVREYRKIMAERNPRPPAGLADPAYRPHDHSFVSFEGFLNAKVLVRIIQLMKGNIAKERLPEVVERLDHMDLGIGVPVSFGPDRHQGMNQVYFTTVNKGRFVPIMDWNGWRK